MTPSFYSADDHLDLNHLPPDLFMARLPARWRAEGPKVVENAGGAFWEAEGVQLGFSGRRPRNARQHAGAIARAGLEDDGFRASTPALRLADMDMDGIEAEVIYGPARGFPLRDPELKAAVLGAYNDWGAEFSSAAPDRLSVLAILPVHAPAAAAAELRRVAGIG